VRVEGLLLTAPLYSLPGAKTSPRPARALRGFRAKDRGSSMFLFIERLAEEAIVRHMPELYCGRGEDA
jgi:hypothetical protein